MNQKEFERQQARVAEQIRRDLAQSVLEEAQRNPQIAQIGERQENIRTFAEGVAKESFVPRKVGRALEHARERGDEDLLPVWAEMRNQVLPEIQTQALMQHRVKTQRAIVGGEIRNELARVVLARAQRDNEAPLPGEYRDAPPLTAEELEEVATEVAKQTVLPRSVEMAFHRAFAAGEDDLRPVWAQMREEYLPALEKRALESYRSYPVQKRRWARAVEEVSRRETAEKLEREAREREERGEQARQEEERRAREETAARVLAREETAAEALRRQQENERQLAASQQQYWESNRQRFDRLPPAILEAENSLETLKAIYPTERYDTYLAYRVFSAPPSFRGGYDPTKRSAEEILRGRLSHLNNEEMRLGALTGDALNIQPLRTPPERRDELTALTRRAEVVYQETNQIYQNAKQISRLSNVFEREEPPVAFNPRFYLDRTSVAREKTRLEQDRQLLTQANQAARKIHASADQEFEDYTMLAPERINKLIEASERVLGLQCLNAESQQIEGHTNEDQMAIIEVPYQIVSRYNKSRYNFLEDRELREIAVDLTFHTQNVVKALRDPNIRWTTCTDRVQANQRAVRRLIEAAQNRRDELLR